MPPSRNRPSVPASSSAADALDPVMDAELTAILARAMGLDAAVPAPAGESPLTSEGDMSEEDIASALDEYDSVEKDMELIDSALSALEVQCASVKGLVAELRQAQAETKASLAAEAEAAGDSAGSELDSEASKTPEVDPSLAPL